MADGGLWLVAGLGNPGARYEHTPHNAGFGVVEALAARADGSWRRSLRFQSRTAKVQVGGSLVLLVKPQTFMNLSGAAVGKLLRYHRVDVERLIVVVDDADLDLGRIRVRARGSSGGHRGVESVIDCIGSQDFVRVRVGIGREQQGQDLVGHVLAPLRGAAREHLDRTMAVAADAVEEAITNGVDRAMNRYNGVRVDAPVAD